MEEHAGPEGMALARALIRGYAGIGRGVKGAECISYLADQVMEGNIKIENGSWVYTDAQGQRQVGGLLGDTVLNGISQLAVEFHNNAGNAELDRYDILERLTQAPQKVLTELESRHHQYQEHGVSYTSRA